MFVAFSPKALSLILATPGAVAASLFLVMFSTLFLIGLKVVTQSGLDGQRGLIVCVSFCLGVGFQFDLIFPELMSGVGVGALSNGMTVGGMAAILLTAFVEPTKSRSSRVETELDALALPAIAKFLGAFASRSGWGPEMLHWLQAVGEEILLTLDEGTGVRGGSVNRAVCASPRAAITVVPGTETSRTLSPLSTRRRCGCCAIWPPWSATSDTTIRI